MNTNKTKKQKQQHTKHMGGGCKTKQKNNKKKN